MKIPDKLKIGGHWFKVIFPYSFTERTDCDGQHDHELKEIRIKGTDSGGAQLPESKIAVILLHEILHACDYDAGYRMFTGEDGERKIEGLSEALFQVLRDNKLRFDEEE